MPNHPFKGWLSMVIFSITLFCPVLTLAGIRDGIRMWRDRNGVLNITNIHPSAPEKSKVRLLKRSVATLSMRPSTTAALAPATDQVVAPSLPRPQTASVTLPPDAARLFSNIYTYVDKLGVKHFTNIPSNDHRYKLKLRASFGASVPISGVPGVRHSAYDDIVAEAAQAYQVDQALVRAMIHAESAFNPMAVSPKGATGLMQLMPDTAQRYGVRDAFNPAENVHGGVRYLRDLLDMFDNNLSLAIAAYNAGENAVTRHGGIPPYAETTDYVQRVLSLHNRYRNQNDTANN
ncbi:soluble lytic murein transglycosylase [Gammaproteobacteria bacterium]